MSKIRFEPCTPSDVGKAVPLIYASGPDAFNFVFKNKRKTAKDFLKYAFMTKGGEFSYDNHYKMMVGGNMIGIGSIFDSKTSKSFTFKDAFKIIRFYNLNAIRILRNGINIEKIIHLPKPGEICLAHLAISPEFRRKGYGQQLIEFLMSKANKKVDELFVLDVSEENPRAKILYDKLGFVTQKHVLSNYKNEFGYVPNHFRMTKS